MNTQGRGLVNRGGRSRTVVTIAAAVLAGFVLLFSATLWGAFKQAADKRVEAAENVAHLIESSVTRTFESAETTLAIIAETAAETPLAPEVLARQMVEGLRFAPHIRQIAVVDSRGVVVAGTRGTGPAGGRLNLAALGLPERAVGGLSNGLRIGALTPGRYLPRVGTATDAASGRTILPAAIRATADLQVIAALNPSHFRNLMSDAPMGLRGGVSLVQFDGTPILPGAAATDGLDLWPAVRGQAEGGVLPLPSSGVLERVAAFRLSARYPVAVAAVVDHRDSLAEWLGGNRRMLLWTAAAAAGLVLAALVLAREMVRRLHLQDQVRLLFEAVEQSVTSIMITNPQGDIVYVNPAFTRLTGYSIGESVGRNPRFLKSGHTPAAEYVRLWSCLTNGESWHGEFHNRTRDGEDLWEMATVSPVRDTDGSTTHYIAAKLDMTSLKRAEAERERLIRALDRANRELTRFAEIAAHHLQEPVRRLLVFADMIGRPGQPADKTAHAAERIQQNAATLRDQLRDIQAYLAAGEPVPESGGTLSPTEIAQHVARDALHEAQDPAARVEIGPLPPVALDATRLGLSLAHLIDNGLKYRRDDVPPLVKVSGESLPGGRVLYRVEDNGRGIPPLYWNRVADVFDRLDADDRIPGTGVGLAIVRRIVESVGGSLQVQASGSLGGTMILMDLPQAEARGESARVGKI